MIELPKQPHDGRLRHCYKCKASFVPCAEYPHARQCRRCRANPPKPNAAPKSDAGHRHDWDKRSLGIMEAAFLRMAWGPKGSTFVTGNCDE